MLCGMNLGCLSFLILFPVGIFIWARGEVRRRNAMPPEELAKLEAEEAYGPLDEKLECIFCHSKNCVRTTKTVERIGSPGLVISKENVRPWDIGNSPGKELEWMAQREFLRTAQFIKAHCMNCGNDWEMFPPEEKAERSGVKN
jgi:hypothetical protein